MSTNKLKMKLLFDEEKKKVLFAETGKDVVDFLSYLLSLPLGKVVNLLSHSNKSTMFGCLNNLYLSVENQLNLLLSDFQLPIIQSRDEIKIYKCPKRVHGRYFVKDPNLTCLQSPIRNYDDDDDDYFDDDQYICGSKMSCLEEDESKVQISSNNVELVNGVMTYMVMDDLMIKPMSALSSICVLKQLNIKDVANLQEIVVEFGMDEGLKILEASLKGKQVLTQVFSFKCLAKLINVYVFFQM